eukprot:scpid52360/ scgid3042/ 
MVTMPVNCDVPLEFAELLTSGVPAMLAAVLTVSAAGTEVESLRLATRRVVGRASVNCLDVLGDSAFGGGCAVAEVTGNALSARSTSAQHNARSILGVYIKFAMECIGTLACSTEDFIMNTRVHMIRTVIITQRYQLTTMTHPGHSFP